MCWAHCRQTPGVLLCGRLPGIRERKVGEGKERKDFIDETLVKNAGGDMLQEQLAMMSYQKKKRTICRLRTAGGPSTLTTEWARLIYERGTNGKEIKIDLHYSTLGEKRGREIVDPDKGFSEARPGLRLK